MREGVERMSRASESFEGVPSGMQPDHLVVGACSGISVESLLIVTSTQQPPTAVRAFSARSPVTNTLGRVGFVRRVTIVVPFGA